MTESAFAPRAEPPKAPPSRARRAAAILALATLLGAGALLRAASLNQPFWMDESFTSTLATQPPSMIFHVCAKDVHPPGYFLLMRGWNALCRAVLRPPPPTEDWTLKDFIITLSIWIAVSALLRPVVRTGSVSSPAGSAVPDRSPPVSPGTSSSESRRPDRCRLIRMMWM